MIFDWRLASKKCHWQSHVFHFRVPRRFVASDVAKWDISHQIAPCIWHNAKPLKSNHNGWSREDRPWHYTKKDLKLNTRLWWPVPKVAPKASLHRQWPWVFSTNFMLASEVPSSAVHFWLLCESLDAWAYSDVQTYQWYISFCLAFTHLYGPKHIVETYFALQAHKHIPRNMSRHSFSRYIRQSCLRCNGDGNDVLRPSRWAACSAGCGPREL